MIIKGKAHCLFEQSGTFKNEFFKLGIPAEDYDIQNNFGQTDHVVDLFAEIENAYDGKASVFDSFTKDDFVMAFFPCIYFESVQMLFYCFESKNYKDYPLHKRVEVAIERAGKRFKYYQLLLKLYHLFALREIPLCIENPYSQAGYLTGVQNFPKPSIIDLNRMTRGDFFVKPTAYWCLNFEPTNWFTYQNDKAQKTILYAKRGKQAGICSEERSMIHPDYARNFICDFIIGKKQDIGQLSLF